MLAPKKSISLEEAIEFELKNLKNLDTLAWMQIGNYMADLREKVNGYLEKTEPAFPELDPLCALLNEMDSGYEKQIQSKKGDGVNLMEKMRVLHFFTGMRKEIGRQIRAGRIHLDSIVGDSPSWPKPRKPVVTPEELSGELMELETDLISKWVEEGFPID